VDGRERVGERGEFKKKAAVAFLARRGEKYTLRTWHSA
jgi:hypothetical protein